MCDDSFSDNSALAICRLMGYIDFTSWRNGELHNNQNNYEIRLDDVECSGGEWENCDYNSDDHNCNHSEDVHLNCGELLLNQ